MTFSGYMSDADLEAQSGMKFLEKITEISY